VAVTRARDTLSVYTPLRLPTHLTSFHARHALAKASRFLTDEACAVLDVQEAAVDDRLAAGAGVAARVEIPTMEELFS
jgi:DNA helicase-2/ATP-dependent DNA helicase PcrA